MIAALVTATCVEREGPCTLIGGGSFLSCWRC
jgi:hypothetical protein